MRIFVITKGERTDTISRLLKEKLPFTVITHRQRNIDRLFELLRQPLPYHLTNKSGCLSSRNALLDLVDDDEWYLSLDDDLKDATEVHQPFYSWPHLPTHLPSPETYNSWRQIYRKPISYRHLIRRMQQLTVMAEKLGTTLAGIATIENPYFRSRKYSRIKNVPTGIHVAKRAGMKRLKGGEYAHDQWQSAYKIAAHGSVLINNFVRVETKAFGDPETGLGTKEQRRPKMEPELHRIEKEFEGLIYLKEYPNMRYRLASLKTVNEWRERNGWIPPWM
jgi:hypothetical protein